MGHAKKNWTSGNQSIRSKKRCQVNILLLFKGVRQPDWPVGPGAIAQSFKLNFFIKFGQSPGFLIYLIIDISQQNMFDRTIFRVTHVKDGQFN